MRLPPAVILKERRHVTDELDRVAGGFTGLDAVGCGQRATFALL